MSTATIDQFVGEIASILKTKDGDKLRQYLIIEPPLPHLYTVIVAELRTSFPPGSNARLETKCEAMIPEYEEGVGGSGGSWPAFIAFLVQYFAFIRDVNAEQLVETHDMIKSLLNQCVLALSDATMGIVVLPTVIALSRTLSRLSIGLEKHPELLAALSRRQSTADSTGGTTERVTLVESSANVIREAFSKCLSERNGAPTAIPPQGRRVGIYVCANLCLKLFFHCRKLRSAEQIFGNIYAQSPPLSAFPAAQRVTYLYYLGRYLFANNHFPRAAAALQAAYRQCHRDALRQRRAILIPLCAANICIGRFPSKALLSRPEMEGNPREAFLALCTALRSGHLPAYRRLVDLDGRAGSWFLRWRILLQLRNRCEVILWRTLARRVFLLAGFRGGASAAGVNARAAPTLDLEVLAIVMRSLERSATVKAAPSHSAANGLASQPQRGPSSLVDPDLEGADLENDSDSNSEDNAEAYDEWLSVVEAGIASLVQQGLLHGYVSHKHCKFVITGAKTTTPIKAGFPPVWSVLRERILSGNSGADLESFLEVPGWVRDEGSGGAGGRGGAGGMRGGRGGMVVKMSGLKTVGASA